MASDTNTSPVMAGSKTRHFKWDVNNETGNIVCTVVATKEAVSFPVGTIVSTFTSLSPIGKAIVTYGLKQVLSDRVADESDTAAKVSAMREVFDDLSNGVWSDRKGSTGPRDTIDMELLSEVLGRIKKKPAADALAYLQKQRATLGDEDFKSSVKAMGKNPEWKVALATVKLEKAKAAAKAAPKEGAAAPASLMADF